MKHVILGAIIGTIIVLPAWGRAPGIAQKFFTEERGFWTIRDRNDTAWPGPKEGEYTNLMVARIHDDELHVTCWVASGPARGGISCVPDAQLNR